MKKSLLPHFCTIRKYDLIVKFLAIFLLLSVITSRVQAQNTCPVFVPKPATYVSATVTATEGNMSYVLDGEGATGLVSDAAKQYGVYWMKAQNPVTFYINMNTPSTISRVKFYSAWGNDEGAKNVTIRLYNGTTLLGTENIVLPYLYASGYFAILGNTYTNVTKVQLVIQDDYGTNFDLRTSLTEIVFGDTACDDVDGDGVADYLDLDDDNDGIKDITENCSGYLAQNTSGAWKGTTSSTLTATLTGATAQPNVHGFSDGQIRYYVNQMGGDPRYSKQGNISFTYTFSNPVPANEIAFFVDDLDPTQFNTPNAQIDFKINGGDPNGNFVLTDYGATPYLNFNVISGRMTPSSVTDNQRIIIKGISKLLISTITITSTGIDSNDALAYALFANHPCDTDGDGVPNIFDLDSDGDGCLDAIEGAGAFTASQLTTALGALTTQNPNQNFGAAVDPANGIPSSVGNTGQGIGNSTDASKNDCIDTDNDGVADWLDLDDDNDGILDTDECPTVNTFADYTTANLIGAATDNATVSEINFGNVTGTLTRVNNGVTVQGGISFLNRDLSNAAIYTPAGSATERTLSERLDNFNNNTNYTTYTLTLDKPVESVTIHLLNFDNMRTRFTGNHKEELMSGGTELVYNPTTRELYDTAPTTVSSVTRDGYGSVKITSTNGSPITQITFIKFDEPNTDIINDQYQYTFSLIPICDDDNDGIPNYLDLDSDGDGCPDAIEGGANFSQTDMVISSMPGGNSGGSYTGPYSSSVVKNLGNVVDANGIPVIAAGGQTIGTSQLVGAQDALCCIAPTQPMFRGVTQPTCSTAKGSFTISNYNAAYTYTFTPSTGVTNNAGTVAAPAGTYTVTATSGACTSVASESVTINAQPATPAQPLLSTVTQPTCSTATGSFTITNYDASYAYTVSPLIGVTISGNTVTAPAGAYTVTATSDACNSVASASVTINAQPGTPAQPLLSAVTQPTCSTASGNFTITNYDAANIYTFTPSAGVVNTAGSVVAPAGTYTVTATAGTCTSEASASVTVDAQPVTPAQPLLGAITQPTCSVSTGSFRIDNYDASFTYAVTSSAGVTISGNTITAPTGTYQVTATSGACTSVASSNVTVYAQPLTPTVTLSTAGPFCANSTPVQLAGSPAGGIFSGIGINIAGLFSPIVAGVGNHTITYTYANQYGCSAVATTNVQVISAPSLSITPTTQTICSGSLATLSVSGDNGGTVNWTSNLLGLTGTGTTFNTGALFNKGASPLTIILNASVTAGSCIDNTSTTVTVNPEPRVLVVPSSAVVCFYEIPHFTLSSVLTGTTINWQLVNNANSSIVSSGSGTDNIVLFSNPIPSGSYTLKVTGTKDGCSSAVVNVPLTVN